MDSPPGRSFLVGAPVCIADLPNSREFRYSDLLREHGIVSLLNVAITFEGTAWGVLEVDSEVPAGAALEDAPFLAGFANLIAHAIRQRRLAAEREAIALDREMLLRKRDVLFRELHHRINNNFHTVAGLVDMAARAASPDARPGFEKLSQRLAAIIDSHERLKLEDLEGDISLSFYLEELLAALKGREDVKFVRQIAGATVPLSVAVPLGMIVNEMVTNSFKHAFVGRGGTIEVSLTVERTSRSGRLMVADDGIGLEPGARRGSGMNLVEALVEQIGGTLERSAAPGGGLVRVVAFPLDGRQRA
jgi:two-component sensor histidine kinase